MAQDLAELFAELDAAKAELARSVRRCRSLIADRQLPPLTIESAKPEKSAFGWSRRQA